MNVGFLEEDALVLVITGAADCARPNGDALTAGLSVTKGDEVWVDGLSGPNGDVVLGSGVSGAVEEPCLAESNGETAGGRCTTLAVSPWVVEDDVAGMSKTEVLGGKLVVVV